MATKTTKKRTTKKTTPRAQVGSKTESAPGVEVKPDAPADLHRYEDHVNEGEFGPELDGPAKTDGDPIVITPLSIELALAVPPPNESQRDCQHIAAQLSREHRMAFAKIRTGLRSSGARLANGRPVWSGADVIRYICERVGAAETSA